MQELSHTMLFHQDYLWRCVSIMTIFCMESGICILVTPIIGWRNIS